MNEEEAIEQLKNILKNTENILKPLDDETPEEVKAFQKMQFKNYNAIKTVLNLLEKKDKQIEQYQNMLATNDILHVLESEKKDKIIDLAVRELYKKAHISKKCYLQKSVEECLKHKNCIACIKQYYERKANET